jgi:hypothetical protein
MLIDLNDLYSVMPKRTIEKLFPVENEREKRLNDAIERQSKIVLEYLGKVASPTPETVKYVVAIKVARELSFEGDLEQLREKYAELGKEAKDLLKNYRDGTILPKDIGGSPVKYSKGVKRRFNFFTGDRQ